jgi:hypothetical protein
MKLGYLSRDRFLLADRETFSIAAPSDSNETPMFEGCTEDDPIGEVPVESTTTTDRKPTPYLDAIKDFSTYLPHLEPLRPQPPPETLKYDKRQPTRTPLVVSAISENNNASKAFENISQTPSTAETIQN